MADLRTVEIAGVRWHHQPPSTTPKARAAGDWPGYDGPHGELVGELEPALVDENGGLGAHQTTRWRDADEARRAATAWLPGGDGVTRNLPPTSPTTKPYRQQALGVRLCPLGSPTVSQIAADEIGPLAVKRDGLDREHAVRDEAGGDR